jgi:probable HAF family extracellular repeat protein
LLFATLASRSEADGPNYSYTDLTYLGNASISSTGLFSLGSAAINSAGTVTGQLGSAPYHAFISQAGTPTDIGVLPGNDRSAGSGISATGTVVGTSYSVDGLLRISNEHGFVYSNGAMTDLGANTSATAINATGQIVLNATSASSAFLYSNGSQTDIGNLGGGFAQGAAINDAGQIAGWSSTASGGTHAFLYSNGAMVDITPAATSSALAKGINNSGAVVGYYWMPAGPMFLYSNGTLTSFGNPGDVAAAINNAGDVTGYNRNGAFLYTKGQMLDLNALIDPTAPLPSGIKLSAGVAINDSGSILATAQLADLVYLYLLTVNGHSAATVTPATLMFGNQTIGTTSAPQAVTVMNTGTVPISSGQVLTSGDFSESYACGTLMPVGGSCVVSVTFTPSGADVRAGTLTIPVAGTNHTVSLSGVGTISVAMSNDGPVTLGSPARINWSAPAGSTCTASGGAPGDGWGGSVPYSGDQAVTEGATGTYTYTVSCTQGSQSAQASTTLVVTVPTVTLTASPTSLEVGQGTTLTWKSTNATSCTGSGGGASDSWPGPRATSGSLLVTEASAMTATYTIICTAGSQSAQASVQVTFVKPSSGGGGGMDFLALAALVAFLSLRKAHFLTRTCVAGES